MKKPCAALALATLAGCGVETATSAATSAQIKRREMEQAKSAMEQAKQKIMGRTTQTDDKMKD